MEYDQLIINAPGFIGHQARAGLVRLAASNGEPLPTTMLHASESGQAVSDSLPSVRFFGDGRVIRIIGVGREGMAHLYHGAPAVIGALRRALGKMPETRYAAGRFGAISLPYAQQYRFDAVVTRLPRPLVEACRESRFQEALPLVSERVQTSLARQFAWLLPDAVSPDVQAIEILRSVAVPLKAGKWRASLSLACTMNCRLSGPWQLGSLQSRGYGRISMVRTNASIEARDNERS